MNTEQLINAVLDLEEGYLRQSTIPMAEAKLPFELNAVLFQDELPMDDQSAASSYQESIPLKKRRYRTDEINGSESVKRRKISSTTSFPSDAKAVEPSPPVPKPLVYAMNNGVEVKNYAVKEMVVKTLYNELSSLTERSCSVESRPGSSETSSSRSSNDENVANGKRRQYNRIPDKMKTAAHMEHRKRNADAVARCREKKKEQEQEMMKKMQKMEALLAEKDETIKKLQCHIDFLMSMQMKNGNFHQKEDKLELRN